jgi:hypothetical protein
MTEHSETPEDPEVEAHGLKEAAAGMSAAAMLAAGAGTAAAATPNAKASARPASHPTQKITKKSVDSNWKIAKKGEDARADYFLKYDQSE